MVNNTTRKAVMTIFSLPTCVLGHCVRLVLHEKGVVADIEFFNPNKPPEDLLELNPTGKSPTLVERDLVLYDSLIIMEYLDERFPYPPLHQIDPISRAKSRMIIKRIDEDWYHLLDEIQNSGEKKSARAKKMLKESLIAATPIFESKPFFMSEEYSLIDCVLAPLLWQLLRLGVDINSLSPAIESYSKRLFSRKAFQLSLEVVEKEIFATPSK